ncbi:Nitrosoguanidine resistance SNG1 [Fusarium agapanthi]|uniref:Nitrosoguanidine resistance SNG1 n=1 Tax=Fusarium agapanthi TaxID=1803897 RepID=A0A9P5E5P4_9HYPO|nr:Nitrosoguanidine resistance SNG1 [Fusarium agapanthi]
MVSNMFLLQSLDLMSKICGVLRRKDEQQRFKEDYQATRLEFQQEYATPRRRITSNSQAAYALAICLDLLEPAQRARAGNRLVELVQKNEFKVSTGFAATPFLCEALSSTGHVQVAYAMLLEKGCPSWLYPVTMGATTVWERWDSILPDGSINPGEMTSFNHYAFGAIAKFMYERVAGLQRLEPGWKRVRISPAIGATFSRAAASHVSPQGTLSFKWETRVVEGEKEEFTVKATVPPNTVAEIILPGLEKEEVKEVGCGRMLSSIESLYPKAFTDRLQRNDLVVRKARVAWFKAAGSNFLYLQLLFLGLFCYILGSLYQQTSHTHNLTIVFVDYDGGAIGQAVRGAYSTLRGKDYPSVIERSTSDFPTKKDLLEAVCKTKYWGAFFVTRGASNRLHEALEGNDTTAGYNNSDVMGYIWNEAVYAPIVDSAISANLQLLSEVARVQYSTGEGTGNIQSVSGKTALAVLAEPWKLQSINIQPTSQGSRAIYNTVVIILIMIEEFCYLGTINGLYAQFKIYTRVRARRIIAVRLILSLIYTFIGSLCVVGAIWAFKASWDVNGNQFVLSWATIWLFAHINFLTLDVFTIWLPPPFIPMALVSWIILNVTSLLLPFDLNPAFYRVGYIFPAHEVYQVLTNIWSRGCNPQLRYALPILFGWEVVTFFLSALGVYRRSHFAMLGEEQQEKDFGERLSAAVVFEMAKIKQATEDRGEPLQEKILSTQEGMHSDLHNSQGVCEQETVREELAEVLESVKTRQEREREMEHLSNVCSFGPTFELPFKYESGVEK